jgi:hypothetical protein
MNSKANIVYCQSCGAELTDKFKVCPSCGSRDFGPTIPSGGSSNSTSPTSSSSTSSTSASQPNPSISTSSTFEEASRGRYILAWIVASISSNIAFKILDALLDKVFPSFDTVNNLYLFLTYTLGSLVSLIVWGAIYQAFENVKISKVMPWFIGCQVLVTALFIFQLLEIQKLGVELPTFLMPTYLVSQVACIYAFYWHFKTKHPHRF